MDELGAGFSMLANLIIWPYLAIFILLSYLVKKAFGDLLAKISKFEWKPVYTVLTLATLVAIPYILFVDDTDWVALLVTYSLGTTFYETILAWIEQKIKKFKTK